MVNWSNLPPVPVGITWAETKKMGTDTNSWYCSRDYISFTTVMKTRQVGGDVVAPVWDFGFALVNMIGYQAQVIPAMLAGFTLVYLEPFFKKLHQIQSQ